MSFDIALSGIQAINQQLESVSNNIANAATYGFKSTRANFSSVYAGAQANGVQVGSLTQSMGQNGSMQTTGNGLDAAIDGRGFFVSRDPQGGMTYSRVGIFSTDAKGALVDSNGRNVQGYAATTNGTLGALGDIQVPKGQIPAVATTKVTYEGNMSANWEKPAAALDPSDPKTYNMVKQSIAYDSLGAQHTVSQYFVQNATATKVDVYIALDKAQPDATTPTKTLTFGSDGQLYSDLTATPPVPPDSKVELTTAFSGGAAAGKITIDYLGSTRFAGEATNTTNRSDGYASGAFVGVELAGDGSLVAKYTNDQSQIVGTVAIANFANEGALTPISDTSWAENGASGTPLTAPPGTGLAGKLNTGALEGSNVDITAQLVGLMTSQRNYQANSKVLTTENQMMQSLMQAL